MVDIVLQVGEDLGIHEVGVEVVVVDLALKLLGQLLAGGFDVDLFGARTGAALVGLLVPENDLLHVLGPTALGLTEAAGKHIDDRLREVAAGL